MTLTERVQALEYEIVEIRQLVAAWREPDQDQLRRYEAEADDIARRIAAFKNDLTRTSNSDPTVPR